MSELTTIDAQTAYGPVSGIVENGITRFLGIPYAAEMTAERRFAAPVRPEPWEEVLPAHTHGSTAPKPELAGRLGELMSDPDVVGDRPDEWLNLNVWTPSPGTQTQLPVMVWIHGGGFTTGSSAVPVYDGTTFARDGVVCVSINYRLGVYGFGRLEGAPDNRGLLDQLFALEWVRDNIQQFGGDPDNVTVCGESAGAMSVLALLSTGTSLFHKAIVQSGTAHLGQSPGDAALVMNDVAKRLNVPATVESLAGVEVAALIDAQNLTSADITKTASVAKYGASTIASCGMSFMPVIDGDLLREQPIKAISSGQGSHVPLLMGTTTEEFRLFVTTSFLAGWDTPILFKPRIKAYGAPDGSYDTYDVDGPVYPRKAAPGVASAVLTDRMFRIPTYRVAEARTDGENTFVYEFGWRSGVTPNNVGVELGACHSLDLPFAWDTLHLPESKAFTGPDAPQALADALHGTWVEFATTGGVNWQPYDEARRTVMCFAHDNTTADTAVEDPRSGERLWWKDALPRT